MKKLLEKKCIICNEPFLRRARTNEKGKHILNGKKYKQVIRLTISNTCSYKCSHIYANVLRKINSINQKNKLKNEKNNNS